MARHIQGDILPRNVLHKNSESSLMQSRGAPHVEKQRRFSFSSLYNCTLLKFCFLFHSLANRLCHNGGWFLDLMTMEDVRPWRWAGERRRSSDGWEWRWLRGMVLVPKGGGVHRNVAAHYSSVHSCIYGTHILCGEAYYQAYTFMQTLGCIKSSVRKTDEKLRSFLVL